MSEVKYEGCAHCIPNKKGHRKNLLVNNFHTRNNVDESIVDFVRIDRPGRKQSKKYYILNQRVTTHTSPSTGKKYSQTSYSKGIQITFCPSCGRCLTDKIPMEHPLRN